MSSRRARKKAPRSAKIRFPPTDAFGFVVTMRLPVKRYAMADRLGCLLCQIVSRQFNPAGGQKRQHALTDPAFPTRFSKVRRSGWKLAKRGADSEIRDRCGPAVGGCKQMNLHIPLEFSFRQLKRPDALDRGLEYCAICVAFKLLPNVFRKRLHEPQDGSTASNSAISNFYTETDPTPADWSACAPRWASFWLRCIQTGL